MNSALTNQIDTINTVSHITPGQDGKSTVIVFISYGKIELYNQVIFSILTLYHWLGGNFENISFVVYTDSPKAFSLLVDLPVSIEVLTKESIARYKGQYSFTHRLKICVAKDAIDKYKQDILLMDSDTYFIGNPTPLLQQINADISLMHREEYDMYDAGEFEDSIWLTIRKIIRNNYFDGNNEKFTIPFSAKMWNSGVVGISYKNAYLLPQILSLADQLYSKSPFFLAEQFAFSVILQKATLIIPTDAVIVHYWNNFGKVLFDYHFKLFFATNKNKLIKEIADNAHALIQKRGDLQMPRPSKLSIIKQRLRLIAVAAIKGKL